MSQKTVASAVAGGSNGRVPPRACVTSVPAATAAVSPAVLARSARRNEAQKDDPGEAGPAGGRQPAEFDGKQQHQHRRQPVLRDRDKPLGDEGDNPVEAAPLVHGRQCADGQGDGQCQQEGAESEGGRHADGPQDLVGHGKPAGKGKAEISLKDTAEPCEELMEERLVEAEPDAQRLDCGTVKRQVRHTRADDGPRRVRVTEPGNQEGEEGNKCQRYDKDNRSLEQKPFHGPGRQIRPSCYHGPVPCHSPHNHYDRTDPSRPAKDISPAAGFIVGSRTSEG